MAKQAYCDPWSSGLASTPRAVANRIARLMKALGDEVNNHVVKGEVADDVRNFKLDLQRKLEADGWSFSYNGGNRLSVRLPARWKASKR